MTDEKEAVQKVENSTYRVASFYKLAIQWILTLTHGICAACGVRCAVCGVLCAVCDAPRCAMCDVRFSVIGEKLPKNSRYSLKRA